MKIMRFNWDCYQGNLYQRLVRYAIAQNKGLILYIIFNLFLSVLHFLNFINNKIYYTNRWQIYFKLEKQDKESFITLIRKDVNEDMEMNYIIDAIPQEILNGVFTKARCYGIPFNEHNVSMPYVESNILDTIKTEFLSTELSFSEQYSDSFPKIDGKTEKKSVNRVWRFYLSTFIVLFGLSFILLMITLLNTSVFINLTLFFSYLKDIPLLLLNIFPIYAVMILCYMLSKRIWVSFAVTGIVTFILSMINFYKLKFRNDPFVISDILLINESKDMASKYSLVPRYYHILMFLFILYIIYRCYKYYRINLHMTVKLRSMVSLVTIFASVVITIGIVFNDFVYERIGDVNAIATRWSGTQQYQRRGFLYPFIHSFTYAMDEEPENFNEEEAKTALSGYENQTIPEDKKANVIAIMLEAYTDLSIDTNLEFDVGVYDYLHELQAESFSGDLVVDIFGGGTVATERSFLTGFMSHPNYLKQTDTYVSYLVDQGYGAYAFHPCYGWFYNRQNINFNLGFQEFHYVGNYFDEITYDDSLFDTLINHYEETTAKSDDPYFNFTVTYQGHGPYAGIDIGNPDLIANKEDYGEEDYYTINNYLTQIYNTNQNIERLIETLRDDDEATIVVLFGDHKPMLGDDLAGYKALNMDVSLETIDGWENYYKVPYVVWGNTASKELTQKELQGDGPTISPNYLMMSVFDLLGWEGNSYMQYLRTMYNDMPIINSVYMKVDEEFKQSLEYMESREYQDYRNIEYYQAHR